jgi:hypothetical protein
MLGDNKGLEVQETSKLMGWLVYLRNIKYKLRSEVVVWYKNAKIQISFEVLMTTMYLATIPLSFLVSAAKLSIYARYFMMSFVLCSCPRKVNENITFAGLRKHFMVHLRMASSRPISAD